MEVCEFRVPVLVKSILFCLSVLASGGFFLLINNIRFIKSVTFRPAALVFGAESHVGAVSFPG